MTTAVAENPDARKIEDREVEVLLTALAKDLMARKGDNAVRIEESDATLLVLRIAHPVRVDKFSDQFPPEYAAELERRMTTIGQGDLLFEFTLNDEAEPTQSRS